MYICVSYFAKSGRFGDNCLTMVSPLPFSGSESILISRRGCGKFFCVCEPCRSALERDSDQPFEGGADAFVAGGLMHIPR